MKEELASFKAAKLAKEKGFDIVCDNWWVETLEHKLDCPRSGLETFPYQPPRIFRGKPFDSYYVVHAKAPTQSILQRWLREKHNIIVASNPMDSEGELYFVYEVVEMFFTGEEIGFEVHSKLNDAFDYSEQDVEGNYLNEDRFREHLVKYSGGKTYEEALEKGLIAALNLIESK